MQHNDHSTLKVLAILAQRADRAAFAAIFSHSNWRLDSCGTLAEAYSWLRDGQAGVIVCDSLLPDGDWKDLLDRLRANDSGSRLIVAIPGADDRVWAEVLNLGGYDALVKPFHKDEVVRLMSLAWLSWKDMRSQTLTQPRLAQPPTPGTLAAMAS